ncbi:MAG: hypothetical protein V7L29_09535 [Nostoc sp.]
MTCACTDCAINNGRKIITNHSQVVNGDRSILIIPHTPPSQL